MRDVKSLATEIEAVLLRRLTPFPVNGQPSIAGIPEAAAEIAANQSRAFEDGALTMRERAEFRARAWMMPELPPGTYTEASERIAAGIQARNEAAVGIADGIAALSLQPEGERSDA